MRSHEIRSSFLSFFEARGHRIVPSSSLIPAGDPTLFFTNAGMNQFKDVFTGQLAAESPRAASAQKCMRVSGKHNDFETVGRSLRHHTFFEMLGNFSFGDYFKREAITSAWELLTGVWKIDPDRLVVSVYQDDEEAWELWHRDVGLAPERIFRLGASENFWSMGETGPRGPCSEIHVDHGDDVGCRREECAPDCDCGRFLEIWNLVFMQFDRAADGTESELPRPSIDTGMGLERVAAFLQGVVSSYDTDLFAPLMSEIARRSGVPHRPVEHGGEAEAARDEQQVSMRVVADHVRAITFLLADGVFPTNEGRGYVLRKLLRRAAGHASKIGLRAPVLSELCGVVIEAYGETHPELQRESGRVRSACEREELAFEATLDRGSEVLDGLLAGLRDEDSSAGSREVSGEDAFRLHDTFGFPLEYTVERARSEGFSVDREGFERVLAEQRERGRAGAKTAAAVPELPAELELPLTEFRGHDETETAACRVHAIVRDGESVQELGAGESGWLVLDRTPFYAESGGQVGDAGWLRHAAGRALVEDTQALRPGVTGHRVRLEEGRIQQGDEVEAQVDGRRRRRIMANHTATHLLHRALKDVLGEHVAQAGSLVAPDRLRFDFSHHEPVSREQQDRIESLVNERVFDHLAVVKEEMPHSEAIERGAVAMFGEKYGDEVRVVSVGDWSVELCGGTHCERTEQIGGLRIVLERGVAAGVRRIEAITGPGLHERLSEDEALIAEVEGALKAPRSELTAAVAKLGAQVKSLKRELDDTRREMAQSGGAAAGERTEVRGHAVETRRLPGLDVKALREMAEGALGKAGVAALLFASEKGGKAALVLCLAEDLAASIGGDAARDLLGELAKDVGGGGGGRATLAWAGGKRAEGIPTALERFPALLEEHLAGVRGADAREAGAREKTT